MNLLLGIAVDDGIYEEYTKRHYAVKHDGKTDMVLLKTVELAANSEDYKVMPEYQKACQKILESVRSEIKNLYRKEEGKREIMKHNTFDGYLDDMKAVFDDATKKKEAAIKKIELSRKQYEANGKEGSSAYVARRKAELLEAEEQFKENLKEIYDQAEEDLNEVQKSFQEHLDSFFMPSGTAVNEEDKRLLDSLELSESECERLALKYPGNVTMLRLLVDYMGKYKGLEKSSIRYQIRHALNISKKKYEDTIKQYAGIVLNTLNESEKFIGAGKKKIDFVDAGFRAVFGEIFIKP